ncbi:hypothetical protein SAMN05421880_10533 [Nitrosomonas nitrosa]|uniref:PIN domain-containing protein n=1 Tax=Nitrosomonas nitrosa TaxID=52442 RepID=A0A1I4MPG6_9PROT|nr:hypothetical protein SAMN05421880_10533 [Nitrosomonas nitrosa]
MTADNHGPETDIIGNYLKTWFSVTVRRVAASSKSNEIAISDLIMAQNVRENHCALFSLDKHFQMLSQVIQSGYTKQKISVT